MFGHDRCTLAAVKLVDLSEITPKKRNQFQSHELSEYALIIAALAVVVCIAYQGFERAINEVVSNVTATLKGA